MAKASDQPLLPNYAFDRLRISTCLQTGNGLSERQKAQSVVNYVIERENQDGSQFLTTIPEGEIYLTIRALDGEVVHLPRVGSADPLYSYLYARYGLSEREKWTRVLYDCLRHYGTRRGVRAYVRRFAVWDRDTQTAYLSCYNGSMWRLDGETITTLPSGEDSVFFLDDDVGAPVNPDIGPHGVLLDTLTNLNFADTPGGVSHDQQRMAMIVWIFALAFPDLMPTKPFLLLEGAPGSGKSAAIKLLQVVLTGHKKPIVVQKSREDDFGLILLRAPIALFDNLDSYMDWLPDALCAYATTGVWPRRKLYSDNEEIVLRPQAFIAVASKNPASFRREDTADRCIVLRLERRAEFVREELLEAQILADRPRLFGEYLHYVNEIVKTIRSGVFAETTETHRMADFAFFARVVGHVLGWEERAIADMIEAMQRERDAFIMEDDSLAEVLHTWIKYKPHGGKTNIGREVGQHLLFQELESVAQAQGLAFYKSSRMLAQKIRSPHLERDFIVQTLVVNGQKAYKIWRRTDPVLHSVTGSSATEKG